MASYKIKTIVMSDGERLPMLLESKTNIPDYWITLYTLTQLRSRGLAVKTIEQTLQHLKLLMYFLKNNYTEEINLEERLKNAKLLDLSEIEILCDICKLKIEDLTEEPTLTKVDVNIKLNSLESFRHTSKSIQINTVSAKTTGHRIRAMKDYLVWLGNTFLSNHEDFGLKTLSLKDNIKTVTSALEARVPKNNDGHQALGKRGLAENELELLFSIIDKNSALNPWKSYFTRTRNELIIFWLYEFGLRRGELLNIKISDLNFQDETVSILRRPDDFDDPRTNQPVVKTQARRLPMPKNILNLTYAYLFGAREKLPESVYHPYLFVADKSGLPMSISALNKVFSDLKRSNQDLPKNFSPHIMRHSWNDNFSKIMDAENIPEEKEKQIRSYLMGWSQTSDSANTYTKRHVEEKANGVILEMNANLVRP